MKTSKQNARAQSAAIVGKPTVISTFAGIGGSSLGYKLAGFHELLAIEWDKSAANNFKLNFKDVPIWVKDITTLSSDEILSFCNIKKGELDVFDGSPPCQGFSISGKRDVKDSRNTLFRQYIKLIKGIEPKVFVMENVSGMIKGKMKGMFIEIMKELKKLNYIVKCKLMNTMHYDVPQARERLIFIGVRKDLEIVPCFPIPGVSVRTVKEAFKGVKNKTFITTKKDYSEMFAFVKPGKSVTQCVPDNILRKFAPRFLDNPKLKTAGFGSRLKLYSPAYTVTKTNTMSATRFIHPTEDRIITIEELKRISSFPDNFKVEGNFVKQWAGFGNCVPPLFMKAIALNIKNNILQKV